MSLSIPENSLFQNARSVISRLQSKGYQAFFAGGCVRDLIMGRKPFDVDIATNAKPDQVLPLFKRTLAIGKAFGVIAVLIDNDKFEVATFRKDGEYLDNRRPAAVEFTDEENDVKRRDLTVNGLLYDPIKELVIDYVGGLNDIEQRVIRAIGEPQKRFSEDSLRLMRVIRFAVQLGFAIEDKTFSAVKKLSNTISNISIERITEELKKILTSKEPARGILLLDETGLLKIILPEITALKGVKQPPRFHPEGDVFEHTILMLEELEYPSLTLALGVLLHDVGKPATFTKTDRIRFHQHEKAGTVLAEEILKRLKFPNNVINSVKELVLQHMKFKDVQKMREAKLKRFLRMENFDEHLELHRLDCIASHGLIRNYNFCKKKIIEYENEEISLQPEMLVSGNDLIDMGLKPGPLFAEILSEIEDLQLENKINTKKEAKTFISKKYL